MALATWPSLFRGVRVGKTCQPNPKDGPSTSGHRRNEVGNPGFRLADTWTPRLPAPRPREQRQPRAMTCIPGVVRYFNNQAPPGPGPYDIHHSTLNPTSLAAWRASLRHLQLRIR